MKLKEMRIRTGMTQAEMSEKFEIPKRTIENWETETRKCPVYVEKLIIEKMEDMIMKKANEVLEKAMEMNVFGSNLPKVEVGEICEINDIWDGNGDCPDSSYSYKLTETDWIDFKFEIVEEKENELDTLVKITNIELV